MGKSTPLSPTPTRREESKTTEIRKVPGGKIIRESSYGKDGYSCGERVEANGTGCVGSESLHDAVKEVKR